MRGRPNLIESIVTLPQLTESDARRTRWRQVVTALGESVRVDGPPPLDLLNSDDLLRACRVALDSGLADDLDWIAQHAAAVALYEITSALPPSTEKREFGRRVFSRLYTGTASAFTAVATRMAMGSGRSLEAATMHARVSLVFALPIGSSVRSDQLAFNLVANGKRFVRWVEHPSGGPLPARRLAATLLERAARETVRRSHQGDNYPLALFNGPRVRPTLERLLADREPLVWRHAAVARGLLSAVDSKLREEIDLQLGGHLSPTEWRRAVVSLVTCLIHDETAMRQCHSILKGDIAEKHPGIGATFLWGLPLVIEAEPEAAEELLALLSSSRERDVATALAALLRDTRTPGIGRNAAHAVATRLAELDARDDPQMRAMLQQTIESLTPADHDDTVHSVLRQALVAFETTGAQAAYELATVALRHAHAHMDEMEAQSKQGDSALGQVAPLLADLDFSVLQRSRMSDLLLLSRRPGDNNTRVPEVERLYHRLAAWALNEEQSYLDEVQTSPGSILARQRKLVTLLHLVDIQTTGAANDDEGTRRLETRLRRTIEVLLLRLSGGTHNSVRRVLCATLARTFDAAIREAVCEPGDLMLLILHHLNDEASILAIREASTNPDLQKSLEVYLQFLNAVTPHPPGSGVLSGSDFAQRLTPAAVADSVVDLSVGVGTHGSYRGEALRQVVLRIGRALQNVATARGLTQIAAGSNNLDAFGELEQGVDGLRRLLRGATKRVLITTDTEAIDVTADVPPLSVLIARAVSSGVPANTDQISMATEELVAELPPALGSAIQAVLDRVPALPISPASDVSVIPLQKRRLNLPDWLLPRRTIAGFYVVRALGSGAVSSVFVARRIEDRHKPDADSYALKVPHYDAMTARALSEQEFLTLFRDEAGALLSLPRHPNLARFVNFDVDARPKPILVMELIRGQPLELLVRNRALTMRDAFSHLDGVLAGLEAMHSVGVAHLDVKPSNVILRDEGTAVLVDFGLSGRHLRPGCGTLEYSAPEIFGVVPEGYQTSPVPTDIYAFACLAFELLTAELLFDANDEMSVISQHINHDGWPEPLALMARTPELADLSVVLAACLRRDPRARPSASATRNALAQAGGRLQGLAWPLSMPISAAHRSA